MHFYQLDDADLAFVLEDIVEGCMRPADVEPVDLLTVDDDMMPEVRWQIPERSCGVIIMADD